MTVELGLDMSLVHLTVIVLLADLSFALQCGVGEEMVECPASCASDYCPKNEGQVKACPKPSHCPPASCKCKFNHRRAENGLCIPTTSCPAFDCSVRPNETYDACPSYCPTDDCSQATPDGRCPYDGLITITVECTPACRCIKGYWRKNGICVPYEKC